MTRESVWPGQVRRRLTIAFVLVAAMAAGVLGLSSFLLVRNARLADSLDRAAQDARFQLLLSQQFTPIRAKHDELLASFENTGHHVVLADGTSTAASDPSYSPQIPPALARRVADGELGYRRLRDGGRPLLLVGGRIPASTAQLYVVADEGRVHADLSQLRNVLLASWAGVVLLAAMIGHALARRTLEPVARASSAARSIAEGLLETRLPAGRVDEFGAWAASFNQMAAALQAKVAALSDARARERRFTADVAHELRTPVTALAACASVLRDELPGMPGSARRPAELLVGDAERLRKLVEELMEISRFDAGHEAVLEQRVRLEPLVAAMLSSRGWDGEVRVIVLTRGASGPEDVELRTDPRRVERIVANLVSNALDHGGSEVTLTLERAGDSIRIVVSDRGPGIAPEHIPHLFDRFFKADQSRSGSGSGLGLAIARENTALLGGEIHVRSEHGVGTEFQLTLPVTRPLHNGEAVTG
jgi:two-component system sensor histidine kinase MtrB